MKKPNIIKTILAGAAIAAVTLIPSLARGEDSTALDVKSSVRARDNTEQTYNVDLHPNQEGIENPEPTWNLSLNAFKMDNGDSDDKETATSARFSLPLSQSISTSAWGRQTTDENQAALDLTIGDHYLQPVWLVWDKENGDFKGADLMAAGEVPVLGLNSNYSTYWVLRDGEEPSSASYLTLDNGKVGLGVAIDYDKARRAMLGASNEDLGMLCDVKFPRNEDGESGDWSGVLMLAQNPGGLLSAKGPKLSGDVFVIGELPEFKTYLSGIANKGSKGASLRVDASNLDGISKGAVEAGYNLGNGLAFSLGEAFSEDGSPSTYGKASVSKGNGFVEARYSENGGLETFLKYQVKIQ